ncbi:MAG: ABC transporter ATP-binding protein [Clostridiaceae bacterium]|jgi:ATP-binding cassette subfamily B protein|nr:ABC transporter ATP-binding protein [Clostridiaceae bacterium]
MPTNNQSSARSNGGFILELMRGNWRAFAACVAAMFASVAASFVSPALVGFLVDSVIGDKPMELPGFLLDWVQALGGRPWLQRHMVLLAGVFLAAVAVSAVFNMLRQYLAAKLSESLAFSLRQRLFDHIQRLPYRWHMGVQTGDIMQRCSSDVDTVRNFAAAQLTDLLRIVAMLIGAFGLMFSINAPLAAAAFAGIPVIMGYSGLFYRLIGRRFRTADEAEGELTAMTQENLTGVRVVKAFGRERYSLDQFRAQNAEFSRRWIKVGWLMALYWSLGDFINVAQGAVVVLFGAWQAVEGNMTGGALITFIMYNGMLTWPTRRLGRIIGEMSKAGVSIGRLREILSVRPEEDSPEEGEPPIQGKIEFRHVSFSYGTHKVLDDVSFTVEPGQTLAILGGTGSGKSTLMHLLNRLYELPEGQGSILLDGVDIRNIRRRYLRKNIGMTLQEPFLFSRTILENLRAAAPDKSEKELFEAAETAAIHQSILGFSQGYETMLGERGVTLSGGQQQRLAIARTLAADPPVLAFDDSLSAVDTETDAQIRRALARRSQKATTIIISHRATTLMEADKILVLEGGRVTQQGTHRQLLEQPGLYQRIYRIQSLVAEEVENETKEETR